MQPVNRLDAYAAPNGTARSNGHATLAPALVQPAARVAVGAATRALGRSLSAATAPLFDSMTDVLAVGLVLLHDQMRNNYRFRHAVIGAGTLTAIAALFFAPSLACAGGLAAIVGFIYEILA